MNFVPSAYLVQAKTFEPLKFRWPLRGFASFYSGPLFMHRSGKPYPSANDSRWAP